MRNAAAADGGWPNRPGPLQGGHSRSAIPVRSMLLLSLLLLPPAARAADSGDEIIVQPGTYVENLNYLGKNLLVRGSEGPVLTILDGSGTAAPRPLDRPGLIP